MPKKWKTGPIYAAIKDKPAKERARTKCKEIVRAVKLTKPKPESLGAAALGGMSATPDLEWSIVHRGETLAVSCSALAENDAGLLTMQVTVRDAGGALRPFNNPLLVYNPPVMVPDGTTYTELIDGEVLTLPNFVEDPVAALRLVVTDAVRGQL